MNQDQKLPAQPVKGLLDGIEVLYELAAATGPVSCRALAARLGIELTRTNRILKTFDHLGMLRRTAARRYEPGPALHVLAVRSMIGSGLLRRALPVLEELDGRRLVTALGVLWRDAVSYLYHHTPGMSSPAALGRVSCYPATRSSIGLILLAGKGDDEVASMYSGREIPGFRDLRALQSELARTKRQGYGLVVNDDGQYSLAVAVGEPAYAGLAVSGFRDRKETPRHLARLKAAAARINGSNGGN